MLIDDILSKKDYQITDTKLCDAIVFRIYEDPVKHICEFWEEFKDSGPCLDNFTIDTKLPYDNGRPQKSVRLETGFFMAWYSRL